MEQRDMSMLTWENEPIQGTSNIITKLQVRSCDGSSSLRADGMVIASMMLAESQGLPFQKVEHKVLTLDAQPASASVAAIIVLVTGQLLVDDGQNVLQYAQMFHVSAWCWTLHHHVLPGSCETPEVDG